MVSQLFKYKVPKYDFIAFLITCCEIDEKNNVYIFSNDAYKRAHLSKTIEPFIDSIIKCYHKSKQYYVSRKMNYTRFVTIVRQICKSNCIPYVSKIRYDRSSYEIVYYICFGNTLLCNQE